MAEPASPPRPLDVDDLAAGLAASLRPAPTGLVLAVSGGPDSVCLMHLAARLAAGAVLPPLTIATLDHGLRPASAAEADGVMQAAAALGLPARRLAWSGPKPMRALQEKARAARYALLADCCRDVGADHLVTAHTRDDQAETVLFRLLRGSGPAGLRAMQGSTTLGPGLTQVRPLLRFDKSRLLATCAAHDWPYVTDPSNFDPRFARPRLRRLMPFLAREGLDAAAFERLADRAGRVEAALVHAADRLADEALATLGTGAVALDLRVMTPLPVEMLIRLLERAVRQVGQDRPIRLDRLEAAAETLRRAAIAGAGTTATLHGAVLRLGLDGRLVVRAEPLRRRGTAPAPATRGGGAHATEPSLGNGGSDPYIAR